MGINELAITWIDGQSLSEEEIECDSIDKAIGLYLILGFSTTKITIQVILSGGETAMLRNIDGTEWLVTVDPLLNEYFALDPAVFAGVAKFKLRRGTQASPVTSGSDTAVKVMRRGY